MCKLLQPLSFSLAVTISPLLSQTTAPVPTGSTNPGRASPQAACGSRRVSQDCSRALTRAACLLSRQFVGLAFVEVS